MSGSPTLALSLSLSFCSPSLCLHFPSSTSFQTSRLSLSSTCTPLACSVRRFLRAVDAVAQRNDISWELAAANSSFKASSSIIIDLQKGKKLFAPVQRKIRRQRLWRINFHQHLKLIFQCPQTADSTNLSGTVFRIDGGGKFALIATLNCFFNSRTIELRHFNDRSPVCASISVVFTMPFSFSWRWVIAEYLSSWFEGYRTQKILKNYTQPSYLSCLNHPSLIWTMAHLNKLLIDFTNSDTAAIKPHRKPNDVLLYVYDLADKLDPVLRYGFKAYAHARGMPEKIIMHTSVVVYGQEYSFGTNGVVVTSTGDQSDSLKPINVFWRGRTALSQNIVASIVQSLIDDEGYIGSEYDLRDKNCNYFSNALLNEIVGSGLPTEWLHLSKHANSLVKRFVPAGLLATAANLDQISPLPGEDEESPLDTPTLMAIAASIDEVTSQTPSAQTESVVSSSATVPTEWDFLYQCPQIPLSHDIR